MSSAAKAPIWACASFVGNRVAFVSSTDFSARCAGRLCPSAPSPWRGWRRKTNLPASRPRDRLARDIPALDLEDSEEPAPEILVERARDAEQRRAWRSRASPIPKAAAPASPAPRVALATSDGFFGRYAGTSHSIGVAVLAGEGTGMERDYDHASARHAADLRSAEDDRPQRRRKAVRRLDPRKVKSQSVPVVFDPREAAGLLGHFAGAISGASHRARRQLPERQDGRRRFSRPASPSSTIRIACAACAPSLSTAKASPMPRRALIDKGVLTTWLLDCASARQLGLAHHRPCRARHRRPALALRHQSLHGSRARFRREALIADIKQGFYVTELMGMGVNGVTGDYSRGAAGFWIENGEIAFPVSEVTIAGNLKDMFRHLTPANDLVFRYGTNAPTLRIEGMTIAGA